MKEKLRGGSRFPAAALAALLFLGIPSGWTQSALVFTGSGSNACQLILNFPGGERVVFHHRWNGTALSAKTLLESVVTATGGGLVVSEGYSTLFDPAVLTLTNPATTGLVVHYQGSYSHPYLNGIRWNGPAGPAGADYRFPDDWWHLWVRGPAHVDQSLAWPDPLPPLDLAPGSSWFFGEFSGLADLGLADGASVGLTFGTADPPSLPAPSVQSVVLSSANTLQIGFSTVPGARYQLETLTDPAGAPWAPVGDPVVASSSSTTFTAPAGHPSGRGFFRLAVLP